VYVLLQIFEQFCPKARNANSLVAEPETDGQTDERTDGHSSSGYTSACIACYANALVKSDYNVEYNVEYVQYRLPTISDVNIKFFVEPDIESKNPISIRISVHSGI